MLFDVLRSPRHVGEEHQKGDGILCHIMIRGCSVNVTGDVNLDHWVKIMSASMLYFKVIVFPFLILLNVTHHLQPTWKEWGLRQSNWRHPKTTFLLLYELLINS